jgi:HEAT repeat protein
MYNKFIKKENRGRKENEMNKNSQISDLERAMQDDAAYARWQAVRVAGQFGASALPLLERAMRDKDPYIKKLAMRIADNWWAGLPAKF